jgi:hypothetical protein
MTSKLQIRPDNFLPDLQIQHEINVLKLKSLTQIIINFYIILEKWLLYNSCLTLFK